MSLLDKAQSLLSNLNDSQRTWLKTVIDLYRGDGKRNISQYQVKALLDGDIPKTFDPSSISSKLLFREATPTPLGILAATPDDPILDDMQGVASAIRKILIDQAEADYRFGDLDASPVEEAVDFPPGRTAQALDQIERVGLWLRQHKHNRETGALETIAIDGKDFDAFYTYDGDIGGLVESALFPQKPESDSGEPSSPATSAHFIDPVFRSRVEHVDTRLGFVIMPFDREEIKGVYKEIVRPTLESEGYRCQRADEVYGQIIMEDVWTKINEAGFIVADLTGLNPNVMYELGIAHTVGKPIVPVTQDRDKIPFDMLPYRAHEYSNDAEGLQKLKQVLREAVPEVLAERKNSSEANKIALRRAPQQIAHVPLDQ